MTIDFAFKWQPDERDYSHLLAYRGRFSDGLLQLGECAIAITCLDQIKICGTHLQLVFAEDRLASFVAEIKILSGNIIALQRALTKALSQNLLAAHQLWLQRQSDPPQYRCCSCPHCHAHIILTSLPDSPYTYCQFCDTLFTSVEDYDLDVWRICDCCRLFARPRQYHLFLFFVIGWKCIRRWCCCHCIRRDIGKSLFFLFFGLPPDPLELLQMARLYFFSDSHHHLAGIHRANGKAKAKKSEEALADYCFILERSQNCPGVLYNIANTLYISNEDAQSALYAALENCANYRPAAKMLRKLGEPAQLPLTQMLEENDGDALANLQTLKETPLYTPVAILSICITVASKIPIFGWMIAPAALFCVLPLFILYLYISHKPHSQWTRWYCLSYFTAIAAVFILAGDSDIQAWYAWITGGYSLVFLRFWGITQLLDGKKREVIDEIHRRTE